MKFADRLRTAWALNPVPKSRLATACKVSKGAVTQWFSGDTRPKSEAAMLLALELGVSLDWLVLGKNPMRVRPDADAEGKTLRDGEQGIYRVAGTAADIRMLPLLDWSTLMLTCPDNPSNPALERFPCARSCGPQSFSLRVQGDSMFPAYHDGELIFVDPDAVAEHNRDVVVRTSEGVMFKRLQLTPEGSYLLALNPDQPQRIMRMPEQCHICGVVIASYMER